ncbi:MAG: hypothetical protein M3N08_01100, partial [Pseudomonadota bacterium]|nr:hypothetical protein [Pseudomonadota bacterium]
FSFVDLEKKLGASAAYQCLLEIEKAAQICSQAAVGKDYETRLRNACRAQDAMKSSCREGTA